MDDDDIELGDQSNSDTEENTHEGSGNRARKRRRSKQAWSLMPAHTPDANVKIALSLYKVQQNIYLLDFQRVEVRFFVCLFVQLFHGCFSVTFIASVANSERHTFFWNCCLLTLFSFSLRRAMPLVL